MSRRPKSEQIKESGFGTDGRDPASRLDWKVIGICAVLAAMVFIVFGQTFGHGFVNYDDGEYVYENAMVSKGFSFEGLRWAFTHVHASNWHPLTTLSHMCDCQCYGLRAGGHHVTNVVLHAMAAALLFLALREMTGAVWRCAFVAAVFAIHPLRVESVAWVAERKDVLSGVFFMLTLWAYARYARRAESRGHWRHYAMVPAWFAMGLMSKPMLVTVPLVLLLVDYWPLGRLSNAAQLPGLLREKIPLFAFSVLSCVATVFAQKQAIAPISYFPFPLRVCNALVAYVAYLWKLIYPAKLAVLYPLVMKGLEAWQVMDACLLLAALTAGAVVLRRRQPYLLVGWLWYLGMLVPVIGILQVGRQAYADRYTYLSEIGLCIAGTWAVVECAAGWRHRRVVLSGVAAAVLATLTASAYRQAGYWRDNETLWRHTVESTKNNDVALFNLGDAVVQSGRVDEGIIYYKMALGISPRDAEGHKTLADALVQSGRMQEAMSEYRTALKLNPDYPQASYNFGMAFTKEGKIREAMAQYRNVLTKHPDSVYPLNGLAWLLATAGDKSLRDGPQAVRLAERAQRLTNGSDANILDTLAAAYAEVGDFASAVRTARSALQVAEAQSNTDLAGLVRREIKLYETQQRP